MSIANEKLCGRCKEHKAEHKITEQEKEYELCKHCYFVYMMIQGEVMSKSNKRMLKNQKRSRS